jgi:hypothetical protein
MPNEDPTIEVLVEIRRSMLLRADAEAVRKFLGENVYRQALLKADTPDEPQEFRLDAA